MLWKNVGGGFVLNTSVLLILIIVQLPRFWVSLSMYCSNLISAKIFTVHTKVKILPHLSPFSMFSWGTKLPAVSLLSVKYVFITEASTASWLLIAILILQFWNDLDCWMAAVACWCSEEHLNINKVLLSLDLSFFQIHVLSIKISWCLWSYLSKILTVFQSENIQGPILGQGKQCSI